MVEADAVGSLSREMLLRPGIEAVESPGCCLSKENVLGHPFWVEKDFGKESYCIPTLFIWLHS